MQWALPGVRNAGWNRRNWLLIRWWNFLCAERFKKWIMWLSKTHFHAIFKLFLSVASITRRIACFFLCRFFADAPVPPFICNPGWRSRWSLTRGYQSVAPYGRILYIILSEDAQPWRGSISITPGERMQWA